MRQLTRQTATLICLIEPERQALQRFAKAEGRTWKAKLRRCWERAEYPGHESIAHHLQAVRNKIGPSGLAKLRA
jgi:hypothetical protein